MRKIRQLIILIIYLDLLLIISVGIAGEIYPSTELKQLLDNSMKWLTWQESVSMRLKIDVLGSENDVQNFHVFREYTFRRDHERIEWIGKIFHHDENINNSHNRIDIMTGKYYLQASYLFNKKPEFAYIQLEYKELQQDKLEDQDTGGPLFGRLYMTDRKNVIEIIKDAQNISLSNEREKINEILCCEVKCQSQYGEVTAWIAPENGCSVMKWMLHKKTENYKGPLDLKDWIETYEIKQLVEIEDTFVPSIADYTQIIEEHNGRKIVNKYNFTIDNVVLEPDFNVIGAFKIVLPNDTLLIIDEYPDIKYTWHENKVMDSYGNEVDLETMGPPSIIGKVLSDFAQFNIKLNSEQMKGKMLLVCFWDSQQRPSRNLIHELTKQEEGQDEKGIVLLLVHTSNISINELNKWIKENNVPFTSGYIKDELQNILHSWNVRAQPWLILTDKNHVVTAEGFAYNELNEKIRDIK